jgi:hypothetical protein
VIGSIRRECLDHLIVFNEAHLRHVPVAYMDYYNQTRTHLTLAKDTPHGRLVQRVGEVKTSRWMAACSPQASPLTCSRGSLSIRQGQ